MRRAPRGDLSTYTRSAFGHDGLTLDVFRKGAGPMVLVLTEIPCISPQVLGFADRLVREGFSVALPDLFGDPGRDPEVGNALQRAALGTLARLCVRREFTMLATRKTSPIVDWLRALGRQEHARCGGPGVGVVGMCFSGGFALGMATDPTVLLPVMSQPGLPAALSLAHKADPGVSPEDLACVAARKDLEVIGLRFHGDPLCPPQRFATLRAALGDRFIAVELDQQNGHPANVLPRHHSVLTRSLIDEPGQPTWQALELVVQKMKERLQRLPG